MDEIMRALVARYMQVAAEQRRAERAGAAGVAAGSSDDEDDGWEDADEAEGSDETDGSRRHDLSPGESVAAASGPHARAAVSPRIADSNLASQLRDCPPVPFARRSSIVGALLEPERRNGTFGALFSREQGYPRSFSAYDKIHVGRQLLPNVCAGPAAEFDAQVFCGKFTPDGDRFVSGCQDQYLRVFDTTGASWKIVKEIHARDVSWSVIDVDTSPDGSLAVYSSWSNYLHLFSCSPMQDTHEELDLVPRHRGRFCVFSVEFHPSGSQLIAGSSDNCVYLYDLNRKQCTSAVPAHHADVNAVCWTHGMGDVFASGGDDALIRIWDRRVLGAERRPMGTLCGHCDGITRMAARGDGVYLASNSKDQTLKLWDMRKLAAGPVAAPPRSTFRDYRGWNLRVARHYPPVQHPSDNSLMTYTGHAVMQTLIRCGFSPSATTGQRYLYTGSGDGCVYVYDILSGALVRVLSGCRAIVRDVSWHPTQPIIAASSWDGSHVVWRYSNPEGDAAPASA